METHTFPHFSPSPSVVHLALFSNITNAAELRSKLIAASTLPAGHPEQEAVNFAFVDAKVITGREQLLAGCLGAMMAKQREELKDNSQQQQQQQQQQQLGQTLGMRTKTIHSEVLFCLMPSSNISDSLRKIGIQPSTRDLILVHICQPPSAGGPESAAVLERMTSLVEGELDVRGLEGISLPSSLEASTPITDWNEVRKLFKLTPEELVLTGGQGEASELDRARGLISSTTSIKNVVG